MQSVSREVWAHRWSALQSYERTQACMEQCALHIAQGRAQDQVWFLNHSPVYTVGRSIGPLEDQLHGISVCCSSRGGDITYHGPEQRMIYPIISLKDREISMLMYLDILEYWVITCLDRWGVKATQDSARRGVWVGLNKICALGIAVKQGVAFHGVALNVYAATRAFSAITPCGIQGPYGVVSLEELGVNLSLEAVDRALWTCCPFICRSYD